jgi:para-aminobenzoate synthetase
MNLNTLIIDNYDSFTFNLSQLFAEVTGEEPMVIANDQLDWDEVAALDPDHIVISAGPGRPENPRDFGISREAIRQFDGPLFGVCLGMQGIGEAYGTGVQYAPEAYHGRVSQILHNGSRLFTGVPQHFSAVRYHSLILPRPVADELEEIAWTADGLVMGIRHRTKPIWAVQFHPESISTEYGGQLVRNFCALARKDNSGRSRKTGTRRNRAFAPAVATAGVTRMGPALNRVWYRKLDFYPEPEQAFASLWPSDTPAVWLDSSMVEPELSRFSYMGGGESMLMARGYSADRRIVLNQNGREWELNSPILDFIQEQIGTRWCDVSDLPFDFTGGFAGYLGYEVKQECGAVVEHRSPHPDAALLFVDRFLAFDHSSVTAYLMALDSESPESWFDSAEKKLRALPLAAPQEREIPAEPIVFCLEQRRDQYLENIRIAQHAIREGETYQVCLTNRLCATASVDPLAYYLALRRTNPAPQSAFLRFPGVTIACSSPETFLRIDGGRTVESKPIKGTSPRGENTEDDSRLCELLRTSVKNRSENLMIVDLVRNDLGKVCTVGSVKVPRLMHLESYATLHQLVSTIRGRLKPGMTAVDCIRSAFPGGSMTGAPKQRTMEIIDRLESSARGVYSGAIGFIGANGSAELNIVIRTAVFAGDQITIGVGGAIISLSNPDEEFDEILLKAEAVVNAFEEATGRRCSILNG